MTIPLVGAGSFFVRVGHLCGGILDINALRGGSATARVLSGANLSTRTFSTIAPDYANGTPANQVINGYSTQYAQYQSSMGSLPLNYQQYAQNTLRFVYGIDQLGIPSTAPLSAFSGISLIDAMGVLIAQMNGASATVQGGTITLGTQTAVGSPTGNPVIVASLKNGLGLTLQLPFPETLTFICTRDVQSGATAGNEQFSIYGNTAVSDTLSQLYPGGSGLNGLVMNLISGATNNSAGNMLVNSDFKTYSTANYPDNWIVGPGTAGTQILNSGTPYTTGGGVIEMAGDGSTLTAIQQKFNTTSSTAVGVGGTPATIAPNAVYHFNGWVKVSAVPSAGVLEVALVDGSGTIIQNVQGVNNSKTLTLSGATTSYVALNGAFQTPYVLPAAVYLRIRQSTAIDNAKNIFLGRFAMTRADSGGNGLYPGGPFVRMFSGNTGSIDGLNPDTYTMSVSNAYATSGSGLMQFMMDRLFGLRAMGLQIPTAPSSPTVSDSLVV